MSIMKNRCCLTVGIIAVLIGIYHLYISSAVWGIVLSFMTPVVLSISICKFLKEHDYSNDYMDAEWSPSDADDNL